MEIIRENWYGLDIDKVKAKFGSDLEYIGDWDIRDMYQPCAVFKNPNPDRSKNHKDFMLLFMVDGMLMVSGIDKDEMEKYRYRNGLICQQCGEVIYSRMRHDMFGCSCTGCAIDGGAAYTRVSGNTGKLVTIDLVEMKVI